MYPFGHPSGWMDGCLPKISYHYIPFMPQTHFSFYFFLSYILQSIQMPAKEMAELKFIYKNESFSDYVFFVLKMTNISLILCFLVSNEMMFVLVCLFVLVHPFRCCLWFFFFANDSWVCKAACIWLLQDLLVFIYVFIILFPFPFSTAHKLWPGLPNFPSHNFIILAFIMALSPNKFIYGWTSFFLYFYFLFFFFFFACFLYSGWAFFSYSESEHIHSLLFIYIHMSLCVCVLFFCLNLFLFVSLSALLTEVCIATTCCEYLFWELILYAVCPTDYLMVFEYFSFFIQKYFLFWTDIELYSFIFLIFSFSHLLNALSLSCWLFSFYLRFDIFQK